MKKGDRKSIKLLLIVSAIVAIVSAALYLYGFLGVEKDTTRNAEQPATTTPIASSAQDWKGYAPELKDAIADAFPDAGVDGAITVSETADLNGDGVDEALLNTGSGGAYTEDAVLAILKDGKPTLAVFKDAEGGVGPILFSNGGSVRHAVAVILDSAARSVYEQNVDVKSDGSGLERCTIAAYQWDSQAKLFAYNETESARAESTFCPLKESEVKRNMGL